MSRRTKQRAKKNKQSKKTNPVKGFGKKVVDFTKKTISRSETKNPPITKQIAGPLADLADAVAADIKKAKTKKDMKRLSLLFRRQAAAIDKLANQM